MAKQQYEPEVTGGVEACLNAIQGDGGLVSFIGRNQPLNRGAPDSRHSTATTQMLDNLTKVFSKGPIYTSIVQVPKAGIDDRSSGRLYISFMGTPPNFGLDQSKVNQAYGLLKKAALSKSLEDKTELFRQLIDNGNPIVRNLHDEYRRSIADEIRQLPSSREHDNQERDLRDARRSVTSFAEASFDRFLSDRALDEIHAARLDSEITVAPHVPHNPRYQGVHVEVKALEYARWRKQHATKFNIGIARSEEAGRDPGCCAGCTLEFDTLGELGFQIDRTTDFPTNFPKTNYQPSANMTTNPAAVLIFAEKMLDICEPEIQDRDDRGQRLLAGLREDIKSLRFDIHELPSLRAELAKRNEDMVQLISTFAEEQKTPQEALEARSPELAWVMKLLLTEALQNEAKMMLEQANGLGVQSQASAIEQEITAGAIPETKLSESIQRALDVLPEETREFVIETMQELIQNGAHQVYQALQDQAVETHAPLLDLHTDMARKAVSFLQKLDYTTLDNKILELSHHIERREGFKQQRPSDPAQVVGHSSAAEEVKQASPSDHPLLLQWKMMLRLLLLQGTL